MSNRCQVTGAEPGYGNQVSHSNRRTRRRWLPNVQNKRYWLAGENRWIRLRVSARGMKTISKRGVEPVVAEMRARGERI